MCRLLGFRSNIPLPLAYPLLEAPNALIRQSKKDSRGINHPDGWGIGYYQNGELAVHKNVAPAYEDAAFRERARQLSAAHAIAHVRAASVGNITLQNAHPFRYQNWLWAHNGTVRPFDDIYQQFIKQIDPKFLARRQGQTDSEMCFLLFLTELAKHAPADLNRPSPELAVESLRRTVQQILAMTKSFILPKPSALTFLATNGEMLLAHRYVTTLFTLQKNSSAGDWLAPVPPEEQDSFRMTILASEPLNDESWQEIPNGHAVVINKSSDMQIVDFAVDGPHSAQSTIPTIVTEKLSKI
jgi:glutamine amidotransferase